MLILASTSTTRANILREHGVQFVQKSSNFDEESLHIKDPKSFVYQATLGKLNSFLKSNGECEALLCADTVVSCEGKILRKAKDKDDAREILNLQSDNQVKIITCMMYHDKTLTFEDISATTYRFGKFDKMKLEQYLSTDDWQGKAGACMVEGFCKDYILTQEGYVTTAKGLCVEKLLPFIRGKR